LTGSSNFEASAVAAHATKADSSSPVPHLQWLFPGGGDNPPPGLAKPKVRSDWFPTTIKALAPDWGPWPRCPSFQTRAAVSSAGHQKRSPQVSGLLPLSRLEFW